MADWSPSSFFGPGTCSFVLGAGFGFLSHRLRTNAMNTFHSKIDTLVAAPILPISSLKLHPIPDQGQLVFLRNGVVSPLSSRLFSSSGREAVLLKMADYTDQPEAFNLVFNGTRVEKFSRVPFSLAENHLCVDVNNADENHLPLELDWSAKSALDPPVSLTETVTRRRFFVEKVERSATFTVSKVTEESVLGVGTQLQYVFGRLKNGDGGGNPVIEPCALFPDRCFTMSKSEVAEMVVSDAETMLKWSTAAGVLSAEFFYIGILRKFRVI